jgi:CPA2 family monovalent cation:H+ antiporter-2
MGALGLQGQGAIVMKMVRRLVWHVILNTALVVAVFIIVAFVYRRGFLHLDLLTVEPVVQRSLAWSLAALLSLPMIVATYRKAGALGMLLAELSIPDRFGARTYRIRAVLARIIPLMAMAMIGLLVAALASTILPPREVVVVLIVVGVGLTWLLWRMLVQVHARLQAALRDTLEKPGQEGGE